MVTSLTGCPSQSSSSLDENSGKGQSSNEKLGEIPKPPEPPTRSPQFGEHKALPLSGGNSGEAVIGLPVRQVTFSSDGKQLAGVTARAPTLRNYVRLCEIPHGHPTPLWVDDRAKANGQGCVSGRSWLSFNLNGTHIILDGQWFEFPACKPVGDRLPGSQQSYHSSGKWITMASNNHRFPLLDARTHKWGKGFKLYDLFAFRSGGH